MRRAKLAIELVSAIGSSAYDLLLLYPNSVQTAEAFDILWHVNPQVFAWLLKQLSEAEQRAKPKAEEGSQP